MDIAEGDALDVHSIESTEPAPTTGEDIGKITWPGVPAEPGHSHAELEGAGPHVPPHFGRPADTPFRGVLEAGQRGLHAQLRVTTASTGLARVDLVLRLPGNGAAPSETRTLRMEARVRESWLTEIARGAATRIEQGHRIIAATGALATIPGQHTVAIVEEGLALEDGVAALAEYTPLPAK